MALTPENNRIKRVGVAIEFNDGRRVMIFSDDPNAEVEVKMEREEFEGFHMGESRRWLTSAPLHTITVGNLSHYTIQHTEPEATAKAIDGIKGQLK